MSLLQRTRKGTVCHRFEINNAVFSTNLKDRSERILLSEYNYTDCWETLWRNRSFFSDDRLNRTSNRVSLFFVHRFLCLRSIFNGQGWNNLSVDIWKFFPSSELIIKYSLFHLTTRKILLGVLPDGSLAQPWDVICCQCFCAYVLLSILISHAKPLKCHTFSIVVSRFHIYALF